jgi:hypothetical protein
VLTWDSTPGEWVAATPSGGSASDPTIPSGGTLYDGTSTSGWTNAGLDTFNADSTIPEHFYLLEASPGGNNCYYVHRSLGGSLPRTYTMKVSDFLMFANYQSVAIVLGDSGGKLVTFGAVSDGNDRYFQRYLWNSASSAGGNANYLSGVGALHGNRLPLYLRIIVNSTTDLDLQVSRGGLIWHEVATAFNPSMTIDRFGMAIFTFGSRGEAAIDWIHES